MQRRTSKRLKAKREASKRLSIGDALGLKTPGKAKGANLREAVAREMAEEAASHLDALRGMSSAKKQRRTVKKKRKTKHSKDKRKTDKTKRKNKDKTKRKKNKKQRKSQRRRRTSAAHCAHCPLRTAQLSSETCTGLTTRLILI